MQDGLIEREKKKKQLDKVFKDSFDAKAIFPKKFLIQKTACRQTVKLYLSQSLSMKWNLAADLVSYQHSSASFYDEGIIKYFEPKKP